MQYLMPMHFQHWDCPVSRVRVCKLPGQIFSTRNFPCRGGSLDLKRFRRQVGQWAYDHVAVTASRNAFESENIVRVVRPIGGQRQLAEVAPPFTGFNSPSSFLLLCSFQLVMFSSTKMNAGFLWIYRIVVCPSSQGSCRWPQIFPGRRHYRPAIATWKPGRMSDFFFVTKRKVDAAVRADI